MHSDINLKLQGLLVYGWQGREIARRNLDQSVCREVTSHNFANYFKMGSSFSLVPFEFFESLLWFSDILGL